MPEHTGPRGAPATPILRPTVEQAGRDRLHLRWPVVGRRDRVRVHAGATPETIDRSKALPISGAGDDGLFLRASARNRYAFYALTPMDGARSDDRLPSVVAERRLPLEGPDNFRDLGGYRTRDGGQVRWNRLYRSDDLSDLTDRDVDLLASLGIRDVFDLRSEAERTREPDRALDGASMLELGIAVDGVDPVALRHRIRTGRLEPKEVEATMTTAYRSFVTDHADRWATILHNLVEPGSLPTVVHCTAGKDRAGFASALVLLLLGVPEETVFEDYLATNRYQAAHRRWLERLVPLYSLFRTNAGDLAPLLDARRSYLQASLDEIERSWGSVERYAEERLAFSRADLARLRSLLVE